MPFCTNSSKNVRCKGEIERQVTKMGRHIIIFLNRERYILHLHLSRHTSKPVFEISGQVPYKTGCPTTVEGYRLEVSGLQSKGIALCSKNKGIDQSYG